MQGKLIVPFLMSMVGVGLGLWLALSPGSYLRSSEKNTPKWANIYQISDTLGWRIAFRVLGCGILAFMAVYICAMFHQGGR